MVVLCALLLLVAASSLRHHRHLAGMLGIGACAALWTLLSDARLWLDAQPPTALISGAWLGWTGCCVLVLVSGLGLVLFMLGDDEEDDGEDGDDDEDDDGPNWPEFDRARARWQRDRDRVLA